MDYGTLYGAIVVERLRTFGGRLPDWRAHWERMQLGCRTLGIGPTCGSEAFGDALQRILDANQNSEAIAPDVSLVAVATPGNPHFGLGECTLFLHLQQIPWARLHAWYHRGASLVSSSYATGAGTSWPAPIKVRNRLAYYLADREASSDDVRRLGLLRTENGSVADTSISNILVISSEGQWVSPTPNSVMLGTSLRVCESLLADENRAISFRDISFEELRLAKEVILVGNTPCVWHASEIDSQSIGDGSVGPNCQWLQKRWVEHCGFDWLSQGKDANHRTA
jgi:branched-subunit amino acid aminotransferase/4-amino-4-deoxychorismate lyase